MKKIFILSMICVLNAQGQTGIQFSPPAWRLTGNALGNNTSFFGSTDNRSLFFKNNNTRIGKWDTLGVLHIGASSITNTTTNGLLRINQGSIKTDLGTLSNFGAVYGALWFTKNTGTITPGTTNFILLNDGATESYLNAPTDSAIQYFVGGNAGPPRATFFGVSTNDALPSYLFNSRTKTRVTSGVNAIKFYIDLSSTQYKGGPIPVKYGLYINGETISATSASTLIDNYTQWNDAAAAGTNMTIPTAWGFGSNGPVNVGGISLSAGGFTVASKGINTSAGDAATINSPIGRFRKDNTGSSFVLTNNKITANSIIVLTLVSTGITTGNQISVQAGSGTATITFETGGVAAAPSANCDINFHIMN